MESNKKAIEILNDLLQINNDRIEGYEKANEETDAITLKQLFTEMADVSKKLAISLTQEVINRGGIASVESTTSSGKIYRVWMDVKATFTGKDRESILDACEYGEDAAQKAYRDALEEDELPTDVREFIKEQKAELRECHDLIKARRDEFKFADH